MSPRHRTCKYKREGSNEPSRLYLQKGGCARAMRRLAVLLATVALLTCARLPCESTVEAEEDWIGTVITPQLFVRTAPSCDAPTVTALASGEQVAVVEEVQGEAVEGKYSTWYRTPSGYYVYGRYVAQRNGGPGRWIDVDLTKQITTAMVDREPVYGAEVTVGSSAFETPTGVYSILRRVENETMDSASIGIPRDGPGGYYITGVLYTQYFTNHGHALHYNYWVEPTAFGNFPTSHGCIGLKLADAQFFWDFADIGTPVVIHE